MNLIRTIWFYALLVPATIVFCLIAIAGGVLKNRALCKWVERNWSAFSLWVAGIRVEADLTALPAKGPFVVMANHQSQFDIFLVFYVLRHFPLCFVAKKSLFKIPLLGPAMLAAGHVPIDRSNNRESMKAMNVAADRTTEGLCPVVFPEGTRQRQLETLGQFKTGGSILAIKTGSPIVPLVIHGSGSALPAGRFKLGSNRRVLVRALPPIEPGAYTLKQRDQLSSDLHDMMSEAYQYLASKHTGDV
ncbi:MAG: lysophospholipid acyltransferase family protein [Oceanidesulfovibrio sp.]